MSFQQHTIGEICSELLAEAVRMSYSKRNVRGHMSNYLSIIRGYYRNHHICIFSVEATDACLASYRIKFEQGIVTRVGHLVQADNAVRRILPSMWKMKLGPIIPAPPVTMIVMDVLLLKQLCLYASPLHGIIPWLRALSETMKRS